jgi:hypothetical protein
MNEARDLHHGCSLQDENEKCRREVQPKGVATESDQKVAHDAEGGSDVAARKLFREVCHSLQSGKEDDRNRSVTAGSPAQWEACMQKTFGTLIRRSGSNPAGLPKQRCALPQEIAAHRREALQIPLRTAQ